MKMRNALFLILSLNLLSCSHNAEQDDLSRAQSCLDNVSDSDPSAATNCLTFIQSYSDQQSSILKCGILETSGGLTTSKMVTAYNQLQSSTQTIPTAAFLFALGLDLPSATAGYTTAQTADPYCQASGVPGLQYISSIIRAGSFMVTTYGSAVDATSSSSVSTALTNLISKCVGVSPSVDATPLGTIVINLAASYCSASSGNSSQSACSEVNSAVQAANGNAQLVGEAFLCYLDNKTFVPVLDSCQ